MQKARAFFAEREILEVDCPCLTRYPSVDLHIDLFKVRGKDGEIRYLHTSPEYAMKRLLAEGCGDIYQLGHVFRDEEFGLHHNPEFTMAEWYRLGFSLREMMAETADFLRLFLGDHPLEIITYRQAFKRFAHIDIANLSKSDLVGVLHNAGHHLSQELQHADEDTLLQLTLSLVVEKELARLGLVALTEFPSSQAALAATKHSGGLEVGLRFEIYFNGIELANGYEELNDTRQMRARFEKANVERQKLGKEPLPLDEEFLRALPQLPACCGVAVGFDRLVMLHNRVKTLQEAIPFHWENI